MQTINCQACGGTVKFSEGSTVGICEYCGSTVTRSKIEDEQRDAKIATPAPSARIFSTTLPEF